MTHRLALALVILMAAALAGCGGARVPDWTTDGYNNLESFKERYLAGRDGPAEANWRNAVEAIRMSGDMEVLGRAYLTRYAVLTACLETFDDRPYREIEALRLMPENRAFHRFLTGELPSVDDRNLPDPYRGLLKALRDGKDEAVDREAGRIQDPLSRLIGIGVAVRMGHSGESLLKTGLAEASRNGWKRVVLAYLERLRLLYEKRGDAAEAEKTRKTLEILKREIPS
ncbi:MAG: hypothetical protein HPY65_13990 [Syntrophaceae bacterium]|nr:hypothetical protein [Syntrophaceae bacterium]